MRICETFVIKLISVESLPSLIKMAEAFMPHIWAMIGVFAAFVAVIFGIRGGGH